MNIIRRVYAAHTLNAVALSIISIYIPAYLLTLGYSLSRVMFFFVLFHGIGLLFALFIFPVLVKKFGLLNTFKFYYPFQIAHFLLLSLLKIQPISLELVAILGGIANIAYWMPMNIFFIKFSHSHEMEGNLSKFFSLPLIFSIIGPLISALLIPFFGFWPVFGITIIMLLITFAPLAKISDAEISIDFNFTKALQRFSRNKTLFLFELLDNIIEESEWFWGVYVFLIIGSLTTPGIVGSLQAIGGAVFTLVVGRFASKYGKIFVPLAAILLILLTIAQMLTRQPLSAYVVTVAISSVMTLFLVSYFSSVYKTVKNDNEEEFMILREVPTIFGRMIVFAGVYLVQTHLRYFFLLPLITIVLLLILYFWKGKKVFVTEQLEAALATE